MHGITQRLWRIVARSLGVLCVLGAAASCENPFFKDPQYIQSLYGVAPVKLPINQAGYQPESPVHSGTVLTFTATFPEGAVFEAMAYLHGAAGWQYCPLHDDGVAPDIAAQDRVYSGALEWKAEYGVGQVPVHVDARGVVGGVSAYGDEELPPLTVLP
jgi:hypothetical protein